MAMVGQTQNPPQEWVQIDCSKQSARPWLDVAIHASRYVVRPGGRLTLSVRGAHKLCEDGCYKWRIIKGGGDLDLLYGKRNYYTAPGENPECINNPTIQLEYCGVPVDTVVIGISDFVSDDTAYFQAAAFLEGLFPLDNRCKPYVKDLFWCGDKAIKKCCIILYKRACDGRILGKDYIGLRQCCVNYGMGNYQPITTKFQASSMFGFMHGAFGILTNVTYAYAKQDLLDAWVYGQPYKDYKTWGELWPEDWEWTDPLPPGVTLQPGAELPTLWTPDDEVPPGMNIPQIWPEGRPKWWEQRIGGALLHERSILDVRTPEMFEQECCVPEV